MTDKARQNQVKFI